MKRVSLYLIISIIVVVAAALALNSWLQESPHVQIPQPTEETASASPTATAPTAPVACARPDGAAWNFSESTVRIGTTDINVAIADEPAEKQQGLKYCQDLPEGSGMLFVFTPASTPTFWMKDTIIPLDMVWVTQDRVVAITTNVQPQPGASDDQLKQYQSGTAVSAVIELPAGSVDRLGIAAGQAVTLP